MSNTILRYILCSSNYVNFRVTAGFQRLTKTWSDGAPEHEIARHYALANNYAFYEQTVAAAGTSIPFPAEADGFAGFRLAIPNIDWTVFANETPILRGRSGAKDGLFGTWDHEVKTQDRYDPTENMRDPSPPGVTLRTFTDNRIEGKQFIPNCIKNLRIELDAPTEVKFYCFMLGAEEDRNILMNASEIEIGQYERIRIRPRAKN
jgi:hypothetical protein